MNHFAVFTCGVFIGVHMISPISCGTMGDGESDLVRLYRALLRDYYKDVRPALNHTQPLNITFGYALTQIIDVDERNQILTTNAWINQNWMDYKLRWYPPEYNNITVMHLPHEKIWLPDIVLYNNADSHYSTAVMSTDVFVTYDGNVTWLAAAIFKSSCKMNVRYYPFDEQGCLLKFASWAYDGTKLDLIIVSEDGDESNYMKSTEWELQKISVKKNLNYFSCCPEPFPDIDVVIYIKRRPMFYVFNLILPCILITGVALLGFYMPSDSGEKVTLGITTLLSMTVFLMLVAESMPPTSDTLPLIGTYYGVTISIVTLATGMTVFTLNIHHKGLRGRPVSNWMKKIVFGYCSKLVFITIVDWDEKKSSSRYQSAHRTAEYLDLVSNQNIGARFDTSTAANDTTSSDCTLPLLANGGVGVHRSAARADAKTLATDETLFVDRNVSRAWNPSAVAPAPSRDDPLSEFQLEFLKVLNRVHTTIETNERRLAEQDRIEGIKLEWQQVALVCDRFLLIVFTVVTVTTTLLIMYQRQLTFD